MEAQRDREDSSLWAVSVDAGKRQAQVPWQTLKKMYLGSRAVSVEIPPYGNGICSAVCAKRSS